jgi:hypothetical protein
MSLQAPRGSGAPARARVHTPGIEPSEQERHGPWQESWQQTLSTQKVLAHSLPVPHGCPSPFLPQLRSEIMQTMPGAQSSLREQVALQAPVVAEQAKGWQARGPPSAHLPRPSQRAAVISTAAVMHEGGLQMVPAA